MIHLPSFLPSAAPLLLGAAGTAMALAARVPGARNLAAPPPPGPAGGGGQPQRGDRRQPRPQRADPDRHPRPGRRRRQLRAAWAATSPRSSPTTWAIAGCSVRWRRPVHPGRAGAGRHAEFPELVHDWRSGAGDRAGRGAGQANIRVEFPLLVGRTCPQAGRGQSGHRLLPRRQSNWRRIAHSMADVIYERCFGEKGYFDTRVCYIGATGPRDRPDQAAGDHGPGQREQPLPDRRARGWC